MSTDPEWLISSLKARGRRLALCSTGNDELMAIFLSFVFVFFFFLAHISLWEIDRWNWNRGVQLSHRESFISATSPTTWQRLKSSTWAFRLDASPTFSSSRARIRCVLCPLAISSRGRLAVQTPGSSFLLPFSFFLSYFYSHIHTRAGYGVEPV